MRGLPPGTITITETGRAASNTLGSQAIVANGLAFGRDGTVYAINLAVLTVGLARALGGWCEGRLGRVVMASEQAYFDRTAADIFGFCAL